MAPDRSYYKFSHARPNPNHNSRPVTRQQDAAFSLPENVLKKCRLAVKEANRLGDILTWSPVTNAVEPVMWFAPPRQTKSGTYTQWAASAYNNLPSTTLNAPHCPHAISGFQLADDTLMSAHHSRNRGWFFNAKQHKCEFFLNIPPLGSSKLIPADVSDSEDPNAGHWADTDDENESFDLMPLYAKDAQKVREVNEATDRRMASLSWPPPYSPASSLTSPIASTSSSPTQLRPTAYTGGLRSYMSQASADKRLCLDSYFRNHLRDKQNSGLYERFPEQHPAWKSSVAECIAMLAPFHPQTVGTAMPSMSLMTNLCGQMISQLNASMGLPKVTLLRILLQSLDCKGCGCSFSVEGYHAHRQVNPETRQLVCTNTPELLPIEDLYPELAGLYDMATRTYPSGVPLPTHTDNINSILGRAWVTWNSRVGVTKDVWAILSTAWTHCKDCNLVRTFDGDRAHRDENLLCRDIGQGQVSTILGGLHRVNSSAGTMVVWKM